jgi:serine/threonine-protein kinase
MVTEAPTDPMIGRLLDGRYEVRSRIARGGMATVYLATDLRLERRVAIKIMHGHLADDSQFRERFIQEARSAARLAHPNVVNVFDQGQDRDMAYLVMEYLPGMTLRDLLKEHRTLTSEQTLDILEAVLAGLAAAHRAGIVHRDLKPENVLLADDGRIKIGDFGLARAASANTATGAALLGTIAYLSPELVTRGIADTRSDIYAVGIMMYEMLTGEQPFKGTQPMQIAFQHANDTVPPPSVKNPKVPAELDELVLWATAKDPGQRPRDASVMLEQLTDTERELETALTPTRSMATTQRTALLTNLPPTMVFEGGTTGETQRIGDTGSTGDSGVIATEATVGLARSSNRRRARGWWLFALVLLLAGTAGGTGWYFGPGPGGHSTIPASVLGLSESAAAADIRAAGLGVGKSTTAYSPTVAQGLVLATQPDAGSSVVKGSSVTLVLSQGPKPVDAPKLAGLTKDDAIAAVTAAGLVYDEGGLTQRFSPKTDKDVVIAAYGKDPATGESFKLKEGTTYVDQGTVTFLVSLGALPNVEGMSIPDAQAALSAVGVTGVEGAQVFNDDVPAGQVIQALSTVEGQSVKPGDQVLLEISKGPDVVTVPSVVGMSISEATQTIEAADLKVAYDTNVPEEFWATALVQGTTGGTGGEQVKRGSTITIVANYFDIFGTGNGDDGDDDEG